MGILYVSMLALWNSLSRVAMYQTDVIGVKLNERLAPDMLEQLAALDYSSFERQETYEILQKISGSPEQEIRNCFLNILLALQSVGGLDV